jgi:hypothetical protein
MMGHPLQQALRRLRQPQGWCVSAILRTERGFQDHKKTSAKFKEAEQLALEQLEALAGKVAMASFRQRFEHLTSALDFAHAQDGFGLFFDEAGELVVHFAFPVESKVIVDQSFEIRDVLYGASRLASYFALVLGKEDARLYHGVGDRLVQVSDRMDLSEEERIYDDPHGAWKFTKTRGDNDNWHSFLDHIDQILGQYLHRRHDPFVVLGTEADVNYFTNHTKHGNLLAGKRSGSYDHVSSEKILAEIEPLVADLSSRRVQEVMERLDSSVATGGQSRGLQDIWPLARAGRIQTLVLERNARKPGYSSSDGMALFYESNDAAPVYHKDAMDDLAEMVLDMQGEVVFAEPGTMDAYDHVAAILRY